MMSCCGHKRGEDKIDSLSTDKWDQDKSCEHTEPLSATVNCRLWPSLKWSARKKTANRGQRLMVKRPRSSTPPRGLDSAQRGEAAKVGEQEYNFAEVRPGGCLEVAGACRRSAPEAAGLQGRAPEEGSARSQLIRPS